MDEWLHGYMANLHGYMAAWHHAWLHPEPVGGHLRELTTSSTSNVYVYVCLYVYVVYAYVYIMYKYVYVMYMYMYCCVLRRGMTARSMRAVHFLHTREISHASPLRGQVRVVGPPLRPPGQRTTWLTHGYITWLYMDMGCNCIHGIGYMATYGL